MIDPAQHQSVVGGEGIPIPPSPDLKSTARNNGLDVARAAAIVMVVTAHWLQGAWPWFGVGDRPDWLVTLGGRGVDLFFSLSGYLIGRILWRARPSPAGWLRFMTRRWRRTLPLYYAVLAMMVVFAPPPYNFGWHLLHYGTLTQNFDAPMPYRNWFGQSWSLAIEEWFYLLFSCAALTAVSLFGRTGAWVVTIAFVTVPAIARHLHCFAYGELGGFGSSEIVLLRLDAISWGVLFSLVAPVAGTKSRFGGFPWIAAGFAALGWSASALPIAHPFSGGLDLSIIAIGMSLLVVGLARIEIPDGLASRVAAVISDHAYSLYLIHLVIMFLSIKLAIENRVPAYSAVALCLLATPLVAFVSRRTVERQFTGNRKPELVREIEVRRPS